MCLEESKLTLLNLDFKATDHPVYLKSLIITFVFLFSRNFEQPNLLGTHKMLVPYPVLVAEQAELIYPTPLKTP